MGMKFTVRGVRMEDLRNPYEIFAKKLTGRDHLGDLVIDVTFLRKLFLRQLPSWRTTPCWLSATA